MIYYIYTLSHPITNEVRYVGVTINPKRRYKQHLYDKRTSHKANWVQQLRKEKLKPIMNIIEECNKTNWQEQEIFWIIQYNNLTNILKGGGEYERTITDETKKKISKSLSGRNLNNTHKENIRKSQKKRSIIIDEIIYDGVEHAQRCLNIPSGTIWSRCNSNNFKTYSFIN
jgi:hypothetical protein